MCFDGPPLLRVAARNPQRGEVAGLREINRSDGGQVASDNDEEVAAIGPPATRRKLEGNVGLLAGSGGGGDGAGEAGSVTAATGVVETEVVLVALAQDGRALRYA